MNSAIGLSFTNAVSSFTFSPNEAAIFPTFDSALVECIMYRFDVCTN